MKVDELFVFAFGLRMCSSFCFSCRGVKGLFLMVAGKADGVRGVLRCARWMQTTQPSVAKLFGEDSKVQREH